MSLSEDIKYQKDTMKCNCRLLDSAANAAKQNKDLKKRIKELEKVIQKCIDSMKGSNCLEEQWLTKVLKGEL